MIHVGPVAHTLAHALPFALVFPDRFFAFLDKGLHPVLLDLLLAVQAQQLFHFQLYRQAVGIPSGLAQHLFALHGLIPGDQVLDGPGQDMADVGLAVGRGRAVVKGEALAAFPGVHRLANVVFLPEGLCLGLPGQKIQVR